ncbi:MAG: holo-ACP synthase [Candidatus Eisenbacteria bacterium]|nr:holo-ACP synthase [Candidatus Eisenbacteria bacterium]
MIVGIGIDLLEVDRVERELQRGADDFLPSIFLASEIADCARRRHPARHFAARFAAKEAVLKALACGARDIASFREVEVRVADRGQGQVVLHGRARDLAAGRGVRRIALSLALSSRMSAAGVVLES